ncbi:MAG: alpha/beta hydrolase [Acidobacteriota bacterium]
MKVSRIVCILMVLWIAAFSAFADQVPKDNWAKIGDAKLRYYDIGNSKAKSALVFVHCWTCNAEFWKDSYSKFPNYRVIVLDLPGHGKSDKPNITYSMEYFARAVNAVLEHAGVTKAVLVGHSMGTPVIRRYFELYPQKTIALVVVDGALIPLGPRDQMEKFFEPLSKDYKTAAANMIDGMLQPAQPSVKPFVRSAMLETPDYVGAGAAKGMLEDAYAEHGKITVPLLAVMAPSPYWPKDLKEQYTVIAPAIEFHMFDGVSHFVMLDKPKEFNDALAAFIVKNKLL